MARRAAEFGVQVAGPIRVDMKRVKARKNEITGKSRSGLESWLRNTPNCEVYQGHARFESPKEVRVGEELLAGSEIFINVGGRAAIPSMPGVANTPYLTNSTLLDLEILPRHLIIVGGGYVGLEFGQIFRRFGSEVTIIEKASRLIAHEDEDVLTEVQAILEREGIQVLLNATCLELIRHGGEVGVRVDCSEGAPEVGGSHLLLAMGRTPIPGTSGWKKLEWPAMPMETSWWTINCAPVYPASGARRLQRTWWIHTHFLQRFRDRRGQPAGPPDAQRHRSY